MNNIIINTPKAPAPIGPYSQAVWAGNLLFVSGQIAIDPATNKWATNNILGESTQVMENIKAILMEANLNFNNVVKTTIFLSDMEHFKIVNEVYEKYFNNYFPARETVAVKGLPKNANVEISIIASK